MKRTAFSMLELVVIIVVVGILSVNLIPAMDRDQAAEAAYQIARHIRLTQHHALIEDRTGADATNGDSWEDTLWRITFVNGTEGNCYRVFADRSGQGNADTNETAVDPLTRKRLNAGSTCAAGSTVPDEILLWKSYGVTSVTLQGGCTAVSNIAFDHLGRPGQISGNTMNFLTSDCNVHIETNDGHDADILITEETGYVDVTAVDGIAI